MHVAYGVRLTPMTRMISPPSLVSCAVGCPHSIVAVYCLRCCCVCGGGAMTSFPPLEHCAWTLLRKGFLSSATSWLHPVFRVCCTDWLCHVPVSATRAPVHVATDGSILGRAEMRYRCNTDFTWSQSCPHLKAERAEEKSIALVCDTASDAPMYLSCSKPPVKSLASSTSSMSAPFARS